MPTDPQSEFAVNDKVRLLVDIWDDGADHHPPGYLAHRGEIVFVRSTEPRTFPVYVSHEGRLDNSFGVELSEIEKVAHD